MPDAAVLARFAPVLDAPRRSGLFVDFDGTMAEIVLDPAAAAPAPGAVEAMEALAGRLGRVGILSGRPLSFLGQFFDGDLVLAGLYGLEWSDGGARRDHPQAGAWREVIDDVAACARARGPDGMRVESKGLSLTLHYREHPELAAAVERWAGEQAARSGLVPRTARMSVELHPPIETDKGLALLEAASELTCVCFIGDDVGDLPAFDALDELAASGVTALRVAVDSDEVVRELVERADLVLSGPRAVVSALDALAAELAVPRA